MIKNKIIKSLALLILIFSTGYSQDVLKLDINKAIQLAMEKNHDLRLARLERDKANEQVSEAWGSAVLPKIDGYINYDRALKRGEFIIETPFFSGSFPQGTENTMTLGATVNQPIFTAAVFLAVRVAKIYAQISEKSVYATQADLILNVKSAYYSVVVTKEVLDLSKLTLQLAEDNLNNTQVRYDAGVVPEYDLVRSKVQVQNIYPQIQRAEKSYQLAENSLKLITGLPLDQNIEVTDSVYFLEKPLGDVENDYASLQERNFLLQQLNLQVRLQDDAVSYQFSKHFPELYFNGSWASTAQENDPRSINQWRYKNSVYVGLNLKIPIFDGFQTTSKVQQAKIDLYKAEEEYTKYSRQLKNTFNDVLLSIDEAKSRINAYSSTIEQAQLGYDIAEKRYNSGVGTQLEIIDALVVLTQAKVDYLSAVYDYYILRAQYDNLLGVGIQETIEE